ncbi:MAG: biotin/lipoyl-containing protein [Thermoanaerobaculia bacterium]|nr:biotin/lipoyl-containing protein [Thermoanaerobaculia bacterium]
MELIVLHDGREEKVVVRHAGERWEVEVAGRTFHVDAAAAGGATRSLLIDGRQFEVAARPLGEGRYQVSCGGALEEVTVVDPLTHLARRSHRAAAAAGPHRVSCRMPGRIVELMVAVGDQVEKGQGLVVVEAMKMENEIEADAAGRVVEIHVEPGQAVEGGDALLDIG